FCLIHWKLHEEAGGGPVSSLCPGARLWLLRQADSRSKEATWASAEGEREGAVRWPWRDEGWAARSTQKVRLARMLETWATRVHVCWFAGGAAKSWKAAKSGARPCDEGGVRRRCGAGFGGGKMELGRPAERSTESRSPGHFFNPQYMYRTDGRRKNYDNSSEVLIGAKNVIKRMLDNEDRAIIACKQMHDYRLQLYHFGTSTAQRATQILSPATPSETIDIEEVFEEEHPLHAWVNASTSVQPEFDPHDRAWAEGELDDVPLLPEFETPPAPKHQKKTVGARGRSTKHGISIADLEMIEEDIDDETPEPRDNGKSKAKAKAKEHPKIRDTIPTSFRIDGIG
ncbi:hypothetical protein Taro_055231, partial [Colocasia esculenta]|nr:hypothetical protein [Colocasia esculenta]